MALQNLPPGYATDQRFRSLEDLPRPEELPIVLRERIPLGPDEEEPRRAVDPLEDPAAAGAGEPPAGVGAGQAAAASGSGPLAEQARDDAGGTPRPE